MASYLRIQWLHNELINNQYPNARQLSIKFEISNRQAQRDIEYFKNALNAPVEYSFKKKGYYYCERFVLPAFYLNNDEAAILNKLASYYSNMSMLGMNEYSTYADLLNKISSSDSNSVKNGINLLTPYTAKIKIVNCRNHYGLIDQFLRGVDSEGNFVFEFHSVELFTGLLFSSGADIRIISPKWLKESFVNKARDIVNNNI